MRGMTIIVKKITQLMVPSIFLLGIYVILHGHLTPGGGFAGGILIAGCFVLQILAFGKEESGITAAKWHAALGESTGIFIFWILGFIGIVQGTNLFVNIISKHSTGEAFSLFSAGIIPLCNIAIGIEVAAALFAVFLAMSVLKTGVDA